jgi:hypothetical protein
VKRYIIAFLVLLLVLVGVVIFWPKEPKEFIGHTVTFSDGTTMTLNDVTYGTTHHYLAGWRGRAISVLPAKWRKKFRVGQGTFDVGQPSIVFWLARRGNGPTTGDPQLILCDRSGYGVSGGYSRMAMGMPGRPDYRLTLVNAVDDKGQPAKEVSSFESPRDWHFSLKVNTNATSLDLTLALHQTRYFDFLVRPQIISTNGEKRGLGDK